MTNQTHNHPVATEVYAGLGRLARTTFGADAQLGLLNYALHGSVDTAIVHQNSSDACAE